MSAKTDALIEDLRAYGVETHGAQAQASLPWIAADALAASEAARVAAEAKAAQLERDWLIRLDQDREFLQQVADSHGIKTDEVTVAFLERKALSSAPVAPAPTDEREALANIQSVYLSDNDIDAILAAGFHRAVPSEATTDEPYEEFARIASEVMNAAGISANAHGTIVGGLREAFRLAVPSEATTDETGKTKGPLGYGCDEDDRG